MKNSFRTSSIMGSGTMLMFFLPPSENFVVKNPILDKYEYSESVYNSHSVKPKFIKNISAFKDLLDGWDGYGAIPLMDSNYRNAISLINSIQEESIRRITDFFPNPNGTLSVIWGNSSSERISLEIGSKTFSYYYKSDSKPPRFYNANPFDLPSYQRLDEMIERVI